MVFTLMKWYSFSTTACHSTPSCYTWQHSFAAIFLCTTHSSPDPDSFDKYYSLLFSFGNPFQSMCNLWCQHRPFPGMRTLNSGSLNVDEGVVLWFFSCRLISVTNFFCFMLVYLLNTFFLDLHMLFFLCVWGWFILIFSIALHSCTTSVAQPQSFIYTYISGQE